MKELGQNRTLHAVERIEWENVMILSGNRCRLISQLRLDHLRLINAYMHALKSLSLREQLKIATEGSILADAVKTLR
jgi:hypothetical protein